MDGSLVDSFVGGLWALALWNETIAYLIGGTSLFPSSPAFLWRVKTHLKSILSAPSPRDIRCRQHKPKRETMVSEDATISTLRITLYFRYSSIEKTDRRQIPHNPLHLISGNLVINHLLYGSMMRRRNSTITLDKHHISAHFHTEPSFTTDHCTLHPSVYLEGPPNSFRNQLRIHPTMRMDSLATLCSYSNTVAHVNHPTFKPFKFSILTSNL